MKKGLRHQKQKYFSILFIRITCTVLGLILFLTVFLYSNFRNFGLELVYRSNEQILIQIADNAKTLNQYAATYAAALMTHPSVAALMYSEELAPIERFKHYEIISNSLHTTPFAHSIYTYNGRTDTYHSIGPVTTMQGGGDFFDEEISHILSQKDTTGKLIPIPRRIPNSKYEVRNFVDVYTYIASETFFRAEDLKNALIVNIKVNWLFDALYASSDPQDIMILDHQGNIIGHSLQEGFLQNIGDQPYVQKILNHGNSSGYFMTDLNDIRTVVTFVSLDFPEWIFISITPYATAATTIQRVQMITGLIFILVLLLGIAITYFLSKNLYSPVDSLRHKIESLAGHVPPKEKASDEFDMISDHVFSTSVELHNLKLFKNSNATLLRNEFLKNLLFQSETCSNDFYKKWDNYSIQLSLHMSTLLFILKIDQYGDFCRLHTNFDQSLYRFALRNICMEVISESFACECISMDTDHLVTLLSVPDPMDIDSLHSTLQQGIQRIQQMFSQYFKVSLSCFISQPTDDLGELPLLYEDTLDLSKYRIKFGHQCILTQDSLRQYSIDFFDIKNENFDKLLSALRNENLDEAQSHLAAFIELLYHASYTTIDFALSYLSTSIFNMLALLEANSAIQFEIDFLSFNTMVERLETLADIQSAYIHLFENIVYRIHGYKDQKSEVVIETVIQYIDNHYMDSNLYAEQLGALVNLSPSYLNKLFRKHTSQSISNYIKEIRLLKAQDLLLKTNDTIEEIADQIGWENKQYFYSVFKKNFGVTPTEYRSKNKTGDLQ